MELGKKIRVTRTTVKTQVFEGFVDHLDPDFEDEFILIPTWVDEGMSEEFPGIVGGRIRVRPFSFAHDNNLVTEDVISEL